MTERNKPQLQELLSNLVDEKLSEQELGRAAGAVGAMIECAATLYQIHHAAFLAHLG